MRVPLAIVPLLAVAALSASGCTSSGWTLRRPSPALAKSDTAKPETAKSETAEKPGTPQSKANPEPKTPAVAQTEPPSPFQSSRDKSPATVAAKPAETAGEAPSAADSSPKSSAGPAPEASPAVAQTRFTAETLKLIDQELRDATPEERAEWYDQLKRVDAAVIPDILRARRLSRQLAEGNRPPQPLGTAADPSRLTDREAMVAAAAPPAAPAHSAIQPAAHAAPSAIPGDVQSAVYQTGTPGQQPTEHAVYRFDPQQPHQQLVLQNLEYEPPPGTTAPQQTTAPHQTATTQPPAYTSPGNAPPGGSPAPIAWPPAKPQPPQQNGLSSVVPFGAGFVQNVVGLVPNRGASQPVTPVSTTAEPQTLVAATSWSQELDRTTAFLEQEIATLRPGTTADEQSAYLRKHVALRMLYLMGHHQERALTAIPGLPPAEQEFWQQLFWGMSNALDSEHIPQPKDRATQTITQLNAALRRLQETADLQIRNVAFCRQILYFGNYERFPRDEFRPGQEVLLYAEIDNFKSEPTSDGQYRTLLRSTLEILSPSGELRKAIDFPATEDHCRNYRRDYFHNYQFVIPERLPLGPHTLKLTVFDELSGKMCSYSVNFVVK